MGFLSKQSNEVTSDEFQIPKWKKIDGDVHILTNRNLGYDLLAVEEFLNNMIAQGWKPVWISGGTRFAFVACQPGAYIARTKLTVSDRGFRNKKIADELSAQLIAEGAEIVEQRRMLGSTIGVIALRPASQGEFELFEDPRARLAEYQKRVKYSQGTATMFFLLALMYFILGLTQNGLASWIALGAVWIALGAVYLRPVKRYKEIVEQLRAEVDSIGESSGAGPIGSDDESTNAEVFDSDAESTPMLKADSEDEDVIAAGG